MIDFKTHDEQIEILRNRGMIIPDDSSVKEFLLLNNYYNVINGFKDIFIQQGKTPEMFISGVSFNELFALYTFDKKLRQLLSQLLIVIERSFASIIAYEFSNSFRNHDDSYLDVNNYNLNIFNTDKATGQKYILANELIFGDKGIKKSLEKLINENNPMICHYKTKYNRIPLWVFINTISFGTLSIMYKCFQSRERGNIAKSFSQISCCNSYPNDIQKGISVLVLLRNKCAHDQRVYDFNPHPTTIGNNDFLNIYLQPNQNKNTLFGAISCMSLFLKKTDFDYFVEILRKQITSLFSSIHSIPTQIILDKMGVPQSFLINND